MYDDSHRVVFVSHLEKHGTDFAPLRKHPLFQTVTDQELSDMYVAYLEDISRHVLISTENKSEIARIGKICRTSQGLRASVSTEAGKVLNKQELSLSDAKLPILLKDKEYAHRQQLSYIRELYERLLAQGSLDKQFFAGYNDKYSGEDFKGPDEDGTLAVKEEPDNSFYACCLSKSRF